MHAESPRFIAGRSDHAALIFLPADDDRQAAQLGAREQLDGHEERVHIDMHDRGKRAR